MKSLLLALALAGWPTGIQGTGASYQSPGISIISTTSNTSTVNAQDTTSLITVPSAVAGDVLVAILPVSSNTATTTQTSPNLTWTLRIKQPTLSDGNGRVEIWTAVASTTLTNEVVTATYSTSNYIGHSITVVRGANTTTFNTAGATNYPSSWVGDPSLTLSGTTAGSLILWGTESYGAGATTFTPDAEQTTEYLIHGGVTDRYWVGRRTSLSPGGNVTVTGQFDIDSWWQAAAIEIKPL